MQFRGVVFIPFSNVAMLGSLGATLLALVLFLYLSHSQMSDTSELVDNNRAGHVIANSRLIRMAIFFIANTLIASCAVFSVVKYRHPLVAFTRFRYIDLLISIFHEK